MRFIGNKENLIKQIYFTMKSKDISGESFFDFFAGTTSVSKFFKNIGYQIYSSDLLYFSYVLQRAYIVNNEELKFEKLLSQIKVNSNNLFASPLELIVQYLNTIEIQKGFIYKNYTFGGTNELAQPRTYFSDENGEIIDSIRIQIENWKINNYINQNEYFVLIACLIETVPFYANISGVFAAFQKNWDPRALKKLTLRPIEYIINKKVNFAFNDDSVNLINAIEADIIYLDPPYNQRQYAPNYHILETIARYDNPIIRGVTRMRGYESQKSKFCNAITGLQELKTIVNNARFQTLILSYNSEGIMKSSDIFNTLSEFGKLDLVEFEYLRFKSNSNGESKNKKFINEQLYILQRK